MANANTNTAFALPVDDHLPCIECGETHCEPTQECEYLCGEYLCGEDHSKTLEQLEADERAAELAMERAADRFERGLAGLFELLCALKAEHDAKAVR